MLAKLIFLNIDMENLELNLEELFEEVKERAMEEGALSRDQWDDMVEAVLDGKREFNEIHDDESWGEIQESLKARFDEFMNESEEM